LAIPALIPHEQETAYLQVLSRLSPAMLRLHPAPETATNLICEPLAMVATYRAQLLQGFFRNRCATR
jgi:hypothetical protein